MICQWNLIAERPAIQILGGTYGDTIRTFSAILSANGYNNRATMIQTYRSMLDDQILIVVTEEIMYAAL
jgi:hypothetical protein